MMSKKCAQKCNALSEFAHKIRFVFHVVVAIIVEVAKTPCYFALLDNYFYFLQGSKIKKRRRALNATKVANLWQAKESMKNVI